MHCRDCILTLKPPAKHTSTSKEYQIIHSIEVHTGKVHEPLNLLLLFSLLGYNKNPLEESKILQCIRLGL